MLARICVVLGIVASGFAVTAPASACACGGIVSAGADATVNNEVALVHWDGAEESIVMQLALNTDTDNVALVVPTPQPATVEAGNKDTFTELEQLTAPRIETKRNWWRSQDTARDGVGASAPGGAPNVLERKQLGPLEATTLSGGDLPGLESWLATNGYTMKPEVTAALAPYVAEQWAFVAIRLTSTDTLTGDLDPIKLTFGSDRFVYPMRMSVAAKTPQTVRLYVLSDHQVQRTDQDATAQLTRVEFADTVPAVASAGIDAGYLTELSVFIREPARITSDFTFGKAADDGPVRQIDYREQDVQILGFMAGPFLVGLGMLTFLAVAAVVLFAVLSRARARRAR